MNERVEKGINLRVWQTHKRQVIFERRKNE